MRQLPPRKRLSKPLIAGAIVIVSTTIAVALASFGILRPLNEAMYDIAFELRPGRNGDKSPIVIVAANEASLKAMAQGQNHWSWPWPRQFWGLAIDYVQKCGAKAAGVDLLFSEPSIYNGELGDDTTFANVLDHLTIPVVQAVQIENDGSRTRFAPPTKRAPVVGAVNLPDGAKVRTYSPMVESTPSFALAAVRSAGLIPPGWSERPFLLHYYGHHQDKQGRTTFPYVSAADVFAAMLDPQNPQRHGIDPSIFKDKIVLFGATAAATYDLKSSPLDRIFPGVEIQATAIENLIERRRVIEIPLLAVVAITLICAGGATIGATTPRRTALKLLISALMILGLAATVVILFRRNQIIWLPPLAPLLAIVLSVVLALSWSYFAEDRQAKFYLKALGQYLSPHVAAELKANPQKLAISAEKRELTILFSDIVGFSDLSERLEENIGPLLNFYLDEMSLPVLAEDGTLDKYIGDAIMSFWNAPVAQADHAARACRAALAMQKRLTEIQGKFAELGASGLSARIGINTGGCTFGNMGSRWKFNYSVIGDSCNLASRLEGANKIYGTRILLGETTALRVRDQFVLRKIDLLQVKGKQWPMAVYELVAAGKPDAATAEKINRYELALSQYFQRDWCAAEQKLLELLAAAPDDGPARELLARVRSFRREPPENWNGVYVAKEK